MNYAFAATNADEIIFKLEIKMKLADWKQIAKALEEDRYLHNPPGRLHTAITEMVSQATANFGGAKSLDD